MASSLLLRSRNPHVCAMSYKLSLLLWHGGAEKQLFTRGSKWGMCMSHRRTLKKIDECGVNYDVAIKEWKKLKEHSCKMESMQDAIQEEIQLGSTTGDVLNNSDILPAINTSSLDLKEQVQKKLGADLFDENLFEEVLLKFKTTEYSLDDNKSKCKLEMQLQLACAAGYQLIGDNLDFLIKVKHMSSTNQNNSVHWFNLNAVLDRVIGQEFQNRHPIKSITDVENVDFLPSPNDNEKLLEDLIPIVARAIVNRMPAFKKFQKVVVWHIPHKYSAIMKTKSIQVQYWAQPLKGGNLHVLSRGE